MKNKIMKWYDWMPFVAGAYAMLLGLGNWGVEARVLILGLVLIHLHFFEEFGFPGGFAWGGIKVEMKEVNPVVAKWQLNQLSAMFGNLWFALAVYLPPLLLEQLKWLVLAAIIFAYVELLGHLVVFNIGLKSWYNPGLVSAVMLAITSTWYLRQPGAIHFSWPDLLIALVWIVLNYWIGFRSPIFKAFNRQQAFAFSRQDVAKSTKYLHKFGKTLSDYQFEDP